MFPVVFPVSIPALAPLYAHAPLIWLCGVGCLWLTRYTHQLGARWGRGYYLLSALVRPAGVALIALGWLALYAPNPGYSMQRGPSVGWLPRGDWTDALCLLAIIIFLALGIWAVLALGLRRTFLFRRLDDGLFTRGPYALVRHPQFLSAIGITFFGTRLFNPGTVTVFADVGAYYQSLEVNWALFALALWILSILEERELLAHYGAEYQEYARRVPRLFPN